MIIASMDGQDGKGKLILLGIEQGNIDLLKQGRPMSISAATHPGFPLPDVTLVIVYGETIEDLTKLLLPGIDDKTVIVDHRKKTP